MSKDIANVGLPEIEVTPEMIEAGASVIWDDPWCDDLGSGYSEDLARRVLEAALSVRRYDNPAAG